MSVAECVISISLALFCLGAGHELIRITSIERSADLIIHSEASTASLTALSHIAKDSFSGDGRTVSLFEKKLKDSIASGLRDPIFHWSFFSSPKTLKNWSIAGIRSYASGPTKKNPFHEINLSTHICISSWLEMFLAILPQNRNCLGQFSSSEGDGKTLVKGILIKVSAQRSVPHWIPTYFLGFYHD